VVRRNEGRKNGLEESGLVAATSHPGCAAGFGVLLVLVYGWHKVVEGYAYFEAKTPWPLVEKVAAIHFPLPVAAAVIASVVQFVGAIAIVLRLYTRTAAIAVAVMLTVALYTNVVTSKDPQLAILYLALISAIGLLGPGQWSLDAVAKTRHPDSPQI
jgi:uncharacterized membrane protein YphA (DoxX/SURF4 family)